MEIKVVIDGAEPQKEYLVVSQTPITFVEVMDEIGLNFYRPCGGLGKCMSCAVRFVYGAPSINAEDERALEFNELRNGWRLGCKCTITKDCKIQVPTALVGEITSPQGVLSEEQLPLDKTNIAIAVDIGTTTIAIAVIDIRTGKILRQASCTNSQTKFGADVMTRIKAAIDGKSEQLMDCVRGDLMELGHKIIGKDFLTHRMVFSGNTTMTHMILKYPVDGMAKYPFVPYTLDGVEMITEGKNIYFMPSISAFVGGDIVSGLYYIKKRKTNGKFLFVDLGTNAELVLFDGKKYYCSSASAGPALEGANISCGVASIKGAINHLSITAGKCKYTTIGGEKPIGLCGSGIIDVVHELRRNGIIDAGGLLIDEYSDTGFPIADGIVMTGEDIQQVLLAKAAIRSGIQMLINESKMDINDIEHLFVAGGLGGSVSVWASAGIGLFPKKLIQKFESVGNSSLYGAITYIMESDQKMLAEIKDNSQVVILATNPEFEEIFIENLSL